MLTAINPGFLVEFSTYRVDRLDEGNDTSILLVWPLCKKIFFD